MDDEQLRQRVSELEAEISHLRFAAPAAGSQAFGPRPSFRVSSPERYTGLLSATAARQWLFLLECYFAASFIVEDQLKRNVFAALLSGPAAIWWECLTLNHPAAARSWPDVRAALLAEFEPVDRQQSLMDTFFSLRQTGPVSAYAAQFRSLLQQLQHCQPVALHLFLGGLKPPIQLQVRVAQPATLSAAITLAVAVDTISLRTVFRGAGPWLGPQPMELGAILPAAETDPVTDLYDSYAAPSPEPEHLMALPSSSHSAPALRQRLTPLQEANARRSGLCLICLLTGHQAQQCPAAQQQKHERAHQR